MPKDGGREIDVSGGSPESCGTRDYALLVGGMFQAISFIQPISLTCPESMDPRADLYRQLNSRLREIRLLNLLPGRWHEPFHCQLAIASLNSPPDYEALSYVWGGSFDDRGDVTINEIDFEVGHNLAQALRHLRSTTTPRTLWIDALCINQEDLDERTDQVRLMGEIYRSARRTVVWLGSFAKSGHLAMELIHRIATEGTSEAFGADSEVARKSLRLVLQCSWWQRAWIIQELALSKEEPILYCGQSSLPWSDFVAFWNATTSTKIQQGTSNVSDVTKWQQFAAHIAPLQLIREWPPDQRSWARLVLLTSHYLATDPRDRLFALHGLVSSHVQPSWLPDYSSDVPGAFTSFTRYMIDSHGLDFICYDKPRRRDDLPSWVPDYSSTCSLADAGGFDFLPEEIKDRADAGRTQDVAFGDDGSSMFFTGLLVDTVKFVVPSGSEIGMKKVFEESLRLYRDVAVAGSHCDGGRVPLPQVLACRRPGYRAEYDTLFGELMESDVPFDFVPSHTSSLGCREQRLLPMLDFMFHAVKRYKFFVTERGLCGMAHPDVREQVHIDVRQGDYVVVGFGCATPLLLRGAERFLFNNTAFDPPPSGQEEKIVKMHRSSMNGRSFNFVGSCSIPSIAKGEFVTESPSKTLYNFEVL